MDFPAILIFPGIILITVPRTRKKGPRKDDWKLAIHAVEVFPILVPRSISKLFLSVITPELTSVTVNEDTKVLDWIIAVTIAPRIKPPRGICVTLFIHRDNFSLPKLSISLLKFCSPWINKVIAAIITITVWNFSILSA